MLDEGTLSALRSNYIETYGDEPLNGVDATDGQLTALSFVVGCGLPPYADFAVFGPHGVRTEKRMRFAQHFQDTSGKWRAIEQAGPANLEVWRACWETFAVAAVSLKVAKLATLARYAQKFEERCNRYPKAWHLCVRADDRCRAEFWVAERRRQQRFSEAHPSLTANDPLMPWNLVIKGSSENLGYWLHELQELALMYTQQAEAPPSHIHQLRDAPPPRKDKGNKGKGGQGHPRKRGAQYVTNKQGREVCWKFNKKTCGPGCPRAHVCFRCLGDHPEVECPHRGNSGKGKKKGDAATNS